MPTIRIELEVPEDDCALCYKGRIVPPQYFLCCTLFKPILTAKDGKYQRCQQCIDAEVKEQPE
jgi:hypothetical protein